MAPDSIPARHEKPIQLLVNIRVIPSVVRTYFTFVTLKIRKETIHSIKKECTTANE